jgi:hypothetical protein
MQRYRQRFNESDASDSSGDAAESFVVQATEMRETELKKVRTDKNLPKPPG